MKSPFRTTRRGLTILEVLFAMVVLLVGLAGVGLLIPLAGRQANDSYAITQGLAAGESALAVFDSNAVVQPRLEGQWQLVDDVSTSTADCASTSFRSMRSMYNSLQASEIAKNPNAYDPAVVGMPTATSNLALLQNQITATGFCIDPLFWGFQPRLPYRIAAGDTGVFRRTRFPYYMETADPVSLTLGGGIGTPRLVRVSLVDPQGTDSNGRNGWLRQPGAVRLATVGGGDLVQASIESNKSLGPIRSVRWAADLSLLSSPQSQMMVSWIATLTPSLSTQFIAPQSLIYQPDTGGNLVPPPINQFPESFDLSVVVFSKRDVREQLSTTTGLLPSGERLFNVADISSDCMTSGTFNMTLSGNANVNARLRIGDWIMLSRNIFVDPSASSSQIRQRHQWYRVIGATGDDAMPRIVRVIGAPWDWTQAEVDFFVANSPDTPPVPTNPAALPVTVATVLKDVVHVYERRIELKMD